MQEVLHRCSKSQLRIHKVGFAPSPSLCLLNRNIRFELHAALSSDSSNIGLCMCAVYTCTITPREKRENEICVYFLTTSIGWANKPQKPHQQKKPSHDPCQASTSWAFRTWFIFTSESNAPSNHFFSSSNSILLLWPIHVCKFNFHVMLQMSRLAVSKDCTS